MERMPGGDPSMPSFSYSQAEREEMKMKRNMTDADIDAKEAEITQKMADKKFEEERKAA